MPEVWPDAVKGIVDTFQQTDIPQLDVSVLTFKRRKIRNSFFFLGVSSYKKVKIGRS